MSNRCVVASQHAVCPDAVARSGWFPNMPAGYADLLRGNLATLASFGVRLAEARALCRTAIAACEAPRPARRTALTVGGHVAGRIHRLDWDGSAAR